MADARGRPPRHPAAARRRRPPAPRLTVVTAYRAGNRTMWSCTDNSHSVQSTLWP